MKSRLLVIPVLVLALAGCTKDNYKIYEDEIASKVYFVQAAANPLYTVSDEALGDEGSIDIAIYNSGNNSAAVKADVVVDEEIMEIFNIENKSVYQVLPEKYYSLGDTSFTFTSKDYRKLVTVNLDKAAFLSDGLDPDDYVLPLSLKSSDPKLVPLDGGSIFLRFE